MIDRQYITIEKEEKPSKIDARGTFKDEEEECFSEIRKELNNKKRKILIHPKKYKKEF